MRAFCFVVAALAMSGCVKMLFTKSSGTSFPARGPTCEFQVLTTPPAGPWTELGTVDIVAEPPDDLASFKHHVQPYVCQAGGDAIVAYANGSGNYMKASVLKVGSTASSSAEAAPTSSGDELGCRYDTQCKGDRLCMEGTCVTPPAPPAAQPASTLPSAPAR